MQDRPGEEKEDPTIGCAVLSLFLVGWLVFTQGPISWFFLGALAPAVGLMFLSDTVDKAKEKRPGFAMRAVSGAVTGGRKFLFNLSIGFGIVLLLQIVFYFYGTHGDANTYGGIEQGLWDWLSRLKAISASAGTIVAVTALVIVSIVVGAWWPVVASAVARKWVGNVTSVLAAALTFSFVTADPAGENYQAATKGVRASFADAVQRLSSTRKEAAALAWANTALEEKLEQPDFNAALGDFLRRAVDQCASYNASMEAHTAAALARADDLPDEFQQTIDWSRRASPNGQILPSTLKQFFPVCERDNLADALAIQLIAKPPADDARQSSWTTDFDRELRTNVSQSQWRERFRRLGEALTDAETARGAMKGALTATIERQVKQTVDLPVSPFVDIIGGAALAALAGSAESRIRRQLEWLAAGNSAAARQSRRILSFAFPDSEFVKSGMIDPGTRQHHALEAVDAAVPQAKRYVAIASRGAEAYHVFIRRWAERQISDGQNRQRIEDAQIEHRRKVDRELREAAERARASRGRRR